MSEDVFYIFAGALVLVALAISLIGVRREEGFPSAGVMRGGLALIAVLVVGTAYFAVQLAQEEKLHRMHEANERADEEAEEENVENQQIDARGESNEPERAATTPDGE